MHDPGSVDLSSGYLGSNASSFSLAASCTLSPITSHDGVRKIFCLTNVPETLSMLGYRENQLAGKELKY